MHIKDLIVTGNARVLGVLQTKDGEVALKNHTHSYLPLSGGAMTGAGPIYFPVTASNNGAASTHYISAGAGYSAASGKYGVKLLCCDQSDCQSGIGQDLSNRAGGYDLSIVGGTSTSGFGTISFVTHPVNSTSYTTLGYFTEAGNLWVSNQVDANSFTARSDKRLKENIKEFEAQKSILDLSIVEFDYKKTGEHAIGCLAQDLQEICPELVKEDENGYLSIYETKLVYLLLQELKKQNKRLAELEAKL
jgi:hypothetical protein